MPVTVNDFYRQAMQPQNENKILQVKDGGVTVAGGRKSPSAAANQQAIDAFVEALRSDYGGHVSSMIAGGILKEYRDQGKPLTGRLVLDVTRLAAEEQHRVKEYNAAVAKQFVNGTDQDGKPQGKNLKAALDELCSQHAIPPASQAAVKTRAEAFFRDKVARGGFYPAVLSLDSLMNSVARAYLRYVGPAAATLVLGLGQGQAVVDLPGADGDKIRLADLGALNDDWATFQRAAWQLGRMREIQPTGELAPATVWRAMFDEDPPAGVASGNFGTALAERCQADMEALSESSGQRDEYIHVALSLVPWDTAKALMRNPGKEILTLKNMPSLGAVFNRMGGLKEAKKCLLGDLSRATGSTPPTFTFNLPGAKASIQTGRTTDFNFADEADKQAYLTGEPNTLAASLEDLCRQLCGQDAAERQIVNTMYCLSQPGLKPLKIAAPLNGVGFGEHAPISVSLSRGPNGAVLAEFTSPKAEESEMGRFHMRVEIARDGAMNVREFELIPPATVRSLAIDARLSRMEDARQKGAAFLAVEGPQGLLATVGARAKTLNVKAEITPAAVRELRTKLSKRIDQAAKGSDANLTPAQVRAEYDAVVNGFFSDLDALANKLPPEKRALFMRSCLEIGILPKPEFLPVLMNTTGLVRGTCDALRNARDGREAAKLMGDLEKIMMELSFGNREFEGKGYSADDFTPLLDLTMRMGLRELMGQEAPDVFALGLTRPGAPFRDMLHAMSHDSGAPGWRAALWFQSAVKDIFSEEPLARLDPKSIRERDLSLSRQREILGGDCAARGAQVAAPGLKALNETLPQDMARMKDYILKEAAQELIKGPVGSRNDHNLSATFDKDYPRDGIYVNGQYHNPGKTHTGFADFIKLFPEPYAAEQLSNLAAQNLNGIVSLALNDPELQRQAGAEAYINAVALNPDLLGLENTSTRNIEAIDPGQGLYRITIAYCRQSSNPQSGLERTMYEMSLEVNLGPPHTDPSRQYGPRATPTVGNVRLDYLIRGREVVPGEPE